MPQLDPSAFSSPPDTIVVNGLLFDMDGTIIDSTNAIVKHWHRLGATLGVDPATILQSSHGRRSVDVLSQYDPRMANWDYVRNIEGRIPREFGQDAEEIPGARNLLSALEQAKVPWTIVTSGTEPLVTGWLEVMGLAKPKTIVTAEDVANGKPDPECYLLGRQRLGFPQNARMLVFEDSPAGIRSGKLAGFQCVALATTHSTDRLKAAGADWIVRDLTSITIQAYDPITGAISLMITNAMR